MGRHRFFFIVLTLAVWMASVVSDPGGPALQSYLPKDTFIIRDTRFISPAAPVIPANTPLLQRGVAPQRSSIPSRPSPQQSISPLRSFQPSSSSQQQANVIPQRPFMAMETHQQPNFVQQNTFMPTNSHQHPTAFASQRPSQQQANIVQQRTFTPVNPQQQSNHISQTSFIPSNTPQQHSDFASQRPSVPSQVHSSVPTNSLRPVSTNHQSTRISQSPGAFQQPSSSQQTNHRFSSTVRPSEVQRPPASHHIIPQNHQRPVESVYRQTPKPQENTIRRPSNRHHLCGVLPPSGDCRAAFPRYYYNNHTDQCDCFLYGGCGSQGLKYSYQTLEECRNTCLPSKMEEGPTCKEIFFEDEVFFDKPNHNLPRPLPSPDQNLPRPHPTSSQIYPPVDTSHIPDQPLLILLVNSASQGNRDAYNTDFESNERRHK